MLAVRPLTRLLQIQGNIQPASEAEPQVYKQLAGALASTQPKTVAESAQQNAK